MSNELFHYLPYISSAMGSWPVEFIENKNLRKIYTGYKFVLNMNVILFNLSLLMEIKNLIIDKQFEEMLEVLKTFLLSLFCISKLYSGSTKEAISLIRRTQELEQELLNSSNPRHKTIHEKHVKLFNLIFFLSFLMGSLVVLLPMVSPTAAWSHPNNSTEVLYYSFQTWTPFDRRKCHILIFNWILFASSLTGGVIMSVNVLLYGFMIFCVIEMKVIQDMVENFREEAVKNRSGRSEEEAIVQGVKMCLKTHQHQIRYVQDVDHLMRNIMLLYFLGCSVPMAITGIQLVTNTNDAHILIKINYLMTLVVQIMVLYWHANEVILESQAVSSAVWHSEWYKCKPDVSKMLLIMMIRAQKPLTLSVGRFYVMSNKTALGILKTAYSYMAMIRQTVMRNHNV